MSRSRGPCVPYATSALDGLLFADPRYECGRVAVPLDHADPDGPRAEVALLRVAARGERIGSLLVNPGGPGGSGTSHVALSAAEFAGAPLAGGPVGDRFDVVGFDPRGVGASTPAADCVSDAELDAGTGIPGTPFTPYAPDAAGAAAIAERCAEGTGGPAALAHLWTRDVVRDLDIVRAALGDEQLSLLGHSYGTELGAMYADEFPGRVRAMVLDGAVDPDVTAAENLVTQGAAFQTTFQTMAAECATRADCPLGPDPAAATGVQHELLRPLQDRPVPAADGRELGFDEAVSAAARCMDWARRTPAEHTALIDRFLEAAPIFDGGRSRGPMHHQCEAWPAPPTRPDPWLPDTVDAPPTLTVSITGDPATPYQGGVNLARRLGGSLLTVDGEQHGIALFGQSPCVDDAVAAYLIDLETPPADARCRA